MNRLGRLNLHVDRRSHRLNDVSNASHKSRVLAFEQRLILVRFAVDQNKKNSNMHKIKILFAHSAGNQGAKGKGSHDLVVSLRKSLGKNFEILYPVLENPEEPTYAQWVSLFEAAFRNLDSPVLLIGHSLGGSMLLKYLSEKKTRITITGIYLVAIPQWSFDGWNAPEFALQNDFSAKLLPLPPIFFYHCLKDPIVPFQHVSFYKNAFPNAVFRDMECADHAFADGLSQLVNDINRTF
jgi:predicted alpha/beta hydrolase family esterase